MAGCASLQECSRFRSSVGQVTTWSLGVHSHVRTHVRDLGWPACCFCRDRPRVLPNLAQIGVNFRGSRHSLGPGKTTRGHSAMILRPWAPFGMPGRARGVPGCHGVAICDPPKQHQTLPGEPGSHSREREGNKSEPKALPKSTCEHRVGVWGKH